MPRTPSQPSTAVSLWRRSLLLLALALPSAPSFAASGEVYVYREPGGTRLFTDRKQTGADYVFIAKFGRPTAVLSCKGLSAAALEARHRGYAETIDRYARVHGVDPALVSAVMRVESCFDHRAVSRVGARGLMQLMPATASQLGVLDSFDPAQNIAGGVNYLGQMLRRFNNDLKLALAAYNAGPGAVERYKGIPPFKETQAYVLKVQSHYQRYRS